MRILLVASHVILAILATPVTLALSLVPFVAESGGSNPSPFISVFAIWGFIELLATIGALRRCELPEPGTRKRLRLLSGSTLVLVGSPLLLTSAFYEGGGNYFFVLPFGLAIVGSHLERSGLDRPAKQKTKNARTLFS
jgi:hypothetical protein